MRRPADRQRRPTHLPRARKRFGQHFLQAVWVDRLIDALEVAPDDCFVEIGPGRGALTRPLAARAARVIAVEIDRDLSAALAPELPPHVTLVNADILAVDLSTLLAAGPRPVRVVGNLPYNISSPILFRLFGDADDGRTIADATVMLQNEVATRLAAGPGHGEYGVLAVQAARVCQVDKVLDLPPGAFRPIPRVHSSVVRLRFRPSPFPFGTPAVFERLVRGVFSQRRKTLANALKPVAATFGTTAPELLERTALDGSVRPEDLNPADFGRLAEAVL